jgi:hypothetical protein
MMGEDYWVVDPAGARPDLPVTSFKHLVVMNKAVTEL